MNPEEKAEMLREVVDAVDGQEGRGIVVEDTPMGIKMGLRAGTRQISAWQHNDTKNGDKMIDVYEDLLVSLYKGDLDVISGVSDAEWPHFVEIVELTKGLDIEEDELKQARSG